MYTLCVDLILITIARLCLDMWRTNHVRKWTLSLPGINYATVVEDIHGAGTNRELLVLHKSIYPLVPS
jgi:hypothetical protein